MKKIKKVLDTPDIVYYNGEAVTSAHIGKPLPRKTEDAPLYGV